MRNVILSTLAALAIAAVPAFAADAASNKKCACGMDVGAAPKTATVKDGANEISFNCCSDACKDKVSKMTADEAKKAFAAHNKVDAAPKAN